MRALALLLLAGATLAGGRFDRHRWSGAVEIAGGHFVVRTNAFPELATSLLGRLKEAYVLYEDRFGPLTGRARLPMRLDLFRNRRDYLEHGDGVEGAVGHFDSSQDRCSIVWRGRVGDTGWPVAIHEACHQYFRRRFPVVQPASWYSEGIACYFEGMVDPTVTRRVARLRIRAATSAFASGEADLGHVLDAKARVTDGRLMLDRFKPSRFYGLAWSLCHFLATDARYKLGFRRFEMRLFATRPLPSRRNAEARRILIEECGSLAKLEKHWHKHLAELPQPASPAQSPVYAWELTAPRAFVRYAALARLDGQPFPSDLRRGVVAGLTDADAIVRTAAARVLSRHMDRDAVPGMIVALDVGDPELKTLALKALAFRGANAAVPRLLRETAERDAALRALAAIGDPRAFPALRRALLDPLVAPSLRARCATALAADPEAQASLDTAAGDPDRTVRNAARVARVRAAKAKAGAKIVRPPAPREKVVKLVAVLRDPMATVAEKRLACTLLGSVRADDAVPALRRLCAPAHDDAVRLEAVRALVKITGETRGFELGQRATAREAAYRAWRLD